MVVIIGVIPHPAELFFRFTLTGFLLCAQAASLWFYVTGNQPLAYINDFS